MADLERKRHALKTLNDEIQRSETALKALTPPTRELLGPPVAKAGTKKTAAKKGVQKKPIGRPRQVPLAERVVEESYAGTP
jgi:hypothetical protein